MTLPSDDWLLTRIQTMIPDEEPIDPDDNLALYGIDSIQVMTLSSEMEARGLPIGFAELAAAPTLTAWRRLIAEHQSG